MTPRNEAIAFRIWAYCDPIGWDCYTQDVADELGVRLGTANNIIRSKGWAGRMRVRSWGNLDGGNIAFFTDESLDGYSNRQAIARMVGGDV